MCEPVLVVIASETVWSVDAGPRELTRVVPLTPVPKDMRSVAPVLVVVEPPVSKICLGSGPEPSEYVI